MMNIYTMYRTICSADEVLNILLKNQSFDPLTTYKYFGNEFDV
jgi:hypothetical protein